MASVQHLREFIRERLTAAATEIFTEVEKTIVRYEEELDAQRRLMGINWKPEIKLHRMDHIEEDTSTIQQLCNQGTRSGHQEEVEPQWTDENQTQTEREDLKIHWIKEEEEPGQLLLEEKVEPHWTDENQTQMEREDLEINLIKKEEEPETPLIENVKEEENSTGVTLMETFTLQEGDLRLEPTTEQVSFHTSPVVEGNDPKGSSSTASESPSYNDRKKKCFTCDICGRSLKKGYCLKLHYQTHTGVKSCSCQICGKSFIHNGALNVHMRTHTGEKPFSCQICEKSFCQIAHLNVHQRTHTGERPFPCETCGKSFTSNGALSVHKRTHTGERPFSCEMCGKSFTCRGPLNVHKRIHTGERPFSCGTCGKSFIHSSTLNVHMKMHTGERSFQCEICGKSFIQIGKLNLHMKQKHKNE